MPLTGVPLLPPGLPGPPRGRPLDQTPPCPTVLDGAEICALPLPSRTIGVPAAALEKPLSALTAVVVFPVNVEADPTVAPMAIFSVAVVELRTSCHANKSPAGTL